MVPLMSRVNKNTAYIRLYDQEVLPKECVESVGVWIDHRLSCKAQTGAA